ncbi:hypothetical protein PIB30_055177 [Stylosanthes scabra]|uniref:Uncharacterized protein n=1 Tax=Stylosanthes scabra TaxID=79078 RepID=A0ABU6WJH6_9FABA|nr:hypothetical protein [Stylosanthes scabra]
MLVLHPMDNRPPKTFLSFALLFLVSSLHSPALINPHLRTARPQVDCSQDTTPPSTASPSTTPPSHFAYPPNHYASPPTHTAFRLRLLRLPPSHRVPPLCISAEPLRFFVEPLRVPPLCLRLRHLPPAHRVPPLREAPITAQSVVDSSLVRLPPLREDTARRDTTPPPSSTPHAEPLHLPPLRSDTTAVTESITTYPLCCQPAPFPQFKSKPSFEFVFVSINWWFRICCYFNLIKALDVYYTMQFIDLLDCL